MCRSCAEGGRRCPGETPEKRRARQNAAYHAKAHATAPRSPESGTGDAAADAGIAPLDGPATREVVWERVEHARSVLERADDQSPGGRLTETNQQGWLVPTEYGLEAEAATRAAGAAIAARADVLAAERLDTATKVDKDVLSFRPEGFSDREEYADHISHRARELKATVEGMRREVATCTDREERADLIRRGNELIPETNKFLKEDALVRQGDSAWDRAEAKVYSTAYLEALSEQRAMGLPDGKMIEVDDKSQKATVKRLEKGLAFYPSDWLARDGEHESTWEMTWPSGGVEQRTERIPLRVKSTSKRAHYATVVTEVSHHVGSGVGRAFYSELLIDKRDEGCLGPGVSTAVHEYGHRAERVQSRVNDLAQAHLARRTTGADGRRHDLEPYLVGKARAKGPPSESMSQFSAFDEGKSEWVRSDDFADRYTGKQNSSRETSSEVFTTGMEGVFGGRFGGLRGVAGWKEDREHRDLILGTLAAVR